MTTLGPGIVAHTLANFPASGQINSGDTWNFQFWYRDPTGPCGFAFNLSNAVSVTIAPCLRGGEADRYVVDQRAVFAKGQAWTPTHTQKQTERCRGDPGN